MHAANDAMQAVGITGCFLTAPNAMLAANADTQTHSATKATVVPVLHSIMSVTKNVRPITAKGRGIHSSPHELISVRISPEAT